jgi:quercetin dioxygenase-like cupin family protein
MHLIRQRAGRPSEQRSDTFTGSVWGDPLSQPGQDPVANTVVFAPGARTYWHRHEGGQLVFPSSGRGFVVRDDGQGGAVQVGDAIWTPGGEVHWHGAAPDSVLVHTAFSFGATEWLHEVDEEDYQRAVREARWDASPSTPGSAP